MTLEKARRCRAFFFSDGGWNMARAITRRGAMMGLAVAGTLVGCGRMSADRRAEGNRIVDALTSYQTDSGHYPASLKEIVPAYLANETAGMSDRGSSYRFHYERVDKGYRLEHDSGPLDCTHLDADRIDTWSCVHIC
jgi:hypothetical protein